MEWQGRDSPTIVTADRKLTPEESRTIIARLEREVGPTDILQKHLTREEKASGSPLITGNKVTLLPDGPSMYAAMTKAIIKAKDHINLETYIFEDDEVGQRFAELLIQKRAEGVQVNLI
jgi:cardiolipin synthase